MWGVNVLSLFNSGSYIVLCLGSRIVSPGRGDFGQAKKLKIHENPIRNTTLNSISPSFQFWWFTGI